MQARNGYLALAVVLVCLGSLPAFGADQTINLGGTTATFDVGQEPDGSPHPNAFQAQWLLFDGSNMLGGEALWHDQFGVTPSPGHLRIDFLPHSLANPGDALVRSPVYSSQSGFALSVFRSTTSISLPIHFEATPGHEITGYRVVLGADYSISPEAQLLNGTFLLSGSMGVYLSGGARPPLLSWAMTSRTDVASRQVTFEGAAPASADFMTFAGGFAGLGVLDPVPPNYPSEQMWLWNFPSPSGGAAIGQPRAELTFRYVDIEVLTSPVPEPASAALTAIGMALLAYRKRRHSRAG
jgi:hypothetical protein